MAILLRILAVALLLAGAIQIYSAQESEADYSARQYGCTVARMRGTICEPERLWSAPKAGLGLSLLLAGLGCLGLASTMALRHHLDERMDEMAKHLGMPPRSDVLPGPTPTNDQDPPTSADAPATQPVATAVAVAAPKTVPRVPLGRFAMPPET